VKVAGIWIAGLMVVAAASGCARRDETLPGDRFDTRTPLAETFAAAPAEGEDMAAAQAEAPERDPLADLRRTPEQPQAVAIALPAATAPTSWTHRGGSAARYAGNLQLSAAPRRVWSTNIGAGNSRRYRISSDPVIGDGRIYTLDSRAQVSAISPTGAVLWRRDLTPASERNADATGGGLAYGDGMLFATTGFGRLVALDPATGTQKWTQRFDAPVTGAPTYADGLVYVSARDNSATAVRAANGRLAWTVPGAPAGSAMISGAGPAVGNGTVVFPSAASELVAARPEGVRIWGASLAGQRRGYAYAGISDITADPVIVGGSVYAGTQSGRFAKLDLATGERIWTATEGAYSPGVPVGGSVFIVSDQGQLVRLDDASGAVIWAVDLPYYRKDRPRRLRAVTEHYGPVLAGGQVIVGSDDGRLRFFSPEDGTLRLEADLPGGAASLPAVVGGTLYILSGNGQLHAFR
jgi:outer membrane protein assembly factor BamB